MTETTNKKQFTTQKAITAVIKRKRMKHTPLAGRLDKAVAMHSKKPLLFRKG